MTKSVPQPSTEHYIVPARQLSGTRDEVLAQIDELTLGLTGLRRPSGETRGGPVSSLSGSTSSAESRGRTAEGCRIRP